MSFLQVTCTYCPHLALDDGVFCCAPYCPLHFLFFVCYFLCSSCAVGSSSSTSLVNHVLLLVIVVVLVLLSSSNSIHTVLIKNEQTDSKDSCPSRCLGSSLGNKMWWYITEHLCWKHDRNENQFHNSDNQVHTLESSDD